MASPLQQEQPGQPQPRVMRGAGGTEGGVGRFFLGFGFVAVAMYLLFDSVRVSTAGYGLISGILGYGRGGHWVAASTGILFVPFVVGIGALFFNARWKWAWLLMAVGIGLLGIEILSRIRFFFGMKLTHLLGMLVLFAAGLGLMIGSFRDEGGAKAAKPEKGQPS